ncbi:MAG: hypothetical protein JO316_17235 [Abitibacteriaceae bacterium]|nr:hypothetical protein [Abditibacteriaceae bacterium]MBV9867101.1 hypothetical protein [Abditibacteriaceae bacterium]
MKRLWLLSIVFCILLAAAFGLIAVTLHKYSPAFGSSDFGWSSASALLSILLIGLSIARGSLWTRGGAPPAFGGHTGLRLVVGALCLVLVPIVLIAIYHFYYSPIIALLNSNG